MTLVLPDLTPEHVILTLDQLDDMLAHYLLKDAWVFDVETIGENRGVPVLNDVVWISFATDDHACVIPMGHPNGDFIRTEYPLLASGVTRQAKGLELRPADYSKDLRKATHVFGPPPVQLTPKEVFNTLAPLFDGDAVKIGHNVKFDVKSTAKYFGEVPAGPFFCTRIASYLVDNRYFGKLTLQDCVLRELGIDLPKGIGKKVEDYSFEDVAQYSLHDSISCWHVWEALIPQLEKLGLNGTTKLEMDNLEAQCEMELTGAPVDEKTLYELKDRLEADVEQARTDVYRAAGVVFNLNSNPEKQRLLFTSKKLGGQGLKGRVLTDTGKKLKQAGAAPDPAHFSVAADALQSYVGNKLVDALIHYADLNKLLSTYVIPYAGGSTVRTTAGKSKTVARESLLIDGRIHTTFDPIGAETGRYSSSNPNLQNVPNPRTPNGKAIRNLFYAGGEGFKQIVADYSQIEPRVIASFSGDRQLVRNYLEGGDIYTLVGDLMGVDRPAGKVLVLAISYGIGAPHIAHNIGCTIQEARALMEGFSQRFSSIDRYRSAIVREARARRPMPYVKTLVGRRRYIPHLLSRDDYWQSRGQRQAFNTMIQGSAADIIKLALIRAHRMIPPEAALSLTVHDEIVTLAPEAYAEETAEAIRAAMEGIKVLKVPLIADVKIVDRWGDAK